MRWATNVSPLCSILSSAVLEAGGHLLRKPDAAIGFAQKQRARIRSQRPAIERRCDFAAANTGELEGILATLCLHRGVLLRQDNPL
jgi:hypothetical protein